jgi:phage terminase large subunit-like protein
MPAASRILAYRRAAREAADAASLALATQEALGVPGEAREPIPGADPEPPELVDPDILLARVDFKAFCMRLGKPPPRHMNEWHKAFVTGESNEHLSFIAGPDTALLSPRGSAKSTFVAMLLAWLVGKHALDRKLLRILYVSYNVNVARAKSAAVKSIVNSEDYRRIFPMVRMSRQKKGDELWSIDFTFAGIDVRGEDAFTLACAGLRGAITSKRANLIVVDDLIKSQADIANPDVRREMEKNWNQVIVPTRFQGGRSLVLGTRFHFDDMFATTFVEKNGWKVLTQAAIEYDNDGKPRSYWPAMHSLKYLLKLQTADHVAFAYQYLNKPVSTTELGISPSLFRTGEVPEVFDAIGVGMDLSAGLTERHDWTVFTLAGRLEDKCYIIDYRRLRTIGNLEKIDALCELLVEWNLLRAGEEVGQFFPTQSEVMIWPEAIAYQKSFMGDFQRIAHEQRHLLNLRPVPVTGFRGDKMARLRGMMGLLQTGKVVFNRYRSFQTMTDEVINFGHCTHDDCADSLNMVVQGLMSRSSVEVDY